MAASPVLETSSLKEAFESVSLEDVGVRHRKERKELQAKIQALKKNAPKSDKKKRKEVMEEIARLESGLEKRQAQELNDAQNQMQQQVIETKDIETKVTENESERSEAGESNKSQEQQPKRVSRAQKRRDKKLREAEEREVEIQACQEDAENAPKAVELRAINNLLKERKLMLQLIPSDGDCLYNAVRNQLLQSELRLDYSVKQLREETANYIAANKDSLICFMTNPKTGDLLSDDEFIAYCDSVRKTPAWGGQIELKALSSILKVPIEVLQATGTPTVQGADEFIGPNLVITYHRHMYSLGEHYNGTKPLVSRQENGDEDED